MKTAAEQDWPIPHTVNDVSAYFGLVSYYMRHILSFAPVATLPGGFANKDAKLIWDIDGEQVFHSRKLSSSHQS